MKSQSHNPKESVEKSELYQALSASRTSFVSTGVFSFCINILMLAPVIYMLEVYDRVLTSSSESTLLMLTLLLVFLFLVMGTLEWVRSQVLIVTGNRLEKTLGPRVFDSLFHQALTSGGSVATAQPLSDLLTLRQFLGGASLLTLFDAPWLPIYLGVVYLFHPLMGSIALAAAIFLIILAVVNERITRRDIQDANKLNIENTQETQLNLRNSEVIEAMGMLPRLRARWQQKQDQLLELQTRASRQGGLITTVSKTFRTTMQSLMLGLGAYLAIQGDISGGTVIAGSILLGRALAPIDQLINSWKSFLGARSAYTRLTSLLENSKVTEPPMPLPPPQGLVEFKKVVVALGGSTEPVLQDISFKIEPGTSVAVIGPSAAGKSTLIRAMLGIYPTTRGAIRLDGAEMKQWDREVLGEHIGYLPQDIELLEGTVSENIARFGQVDPDKVVAAAMAAGVHQMVLQLADGYATKITAHLLSAGQRQRIALARALYGEPKLVVLDEPNSNLDTEGDLALANAVRSLKAIGSTLVVVTHRNNLLQLVDKVMVLSSGSLVAFDNAAVVMEKLSTPQPAAKVLAKPVSENAALEN
ncbi:type I secretion system permease/ATPase [Neptunomonas japonica]|uniref:Type I secretion system ATPase n=1 Tax=Neptunomonas japonica JAMM 1380 TaxID=1441457 RepID=A0A7R6PDV4_9GAMM|nr:type I secretion system permease/ATPase [Neptunomonas japonica]BBB30684.1 type I secretion system ATPase [Neptunomonas japonica JAMM 1380]